MKKEADNDCTRARSLWAGRLGDIPSSSFYFPQFHNQTITIYDEAFDFLVGLSYGAHMEMDVVAGIMSYHKWEYKLLLQPVCFTTVIKFQVTSLWMQFDF